MRQLPEDLAGPLKALIAKHEREYWKDIKIGLSDDAANAVIPDLFLYATDPSGERHASVFPQNDATTETIDKYLTEH